MDWISPPGRGYPRGGFDGLVTLRTRFARVPIRVVSGLDDPRLEVGNRTEVVIRAAGLDFDHRQRRS